MSLKKNIIYLHFKGKHLITSKSQYQYNYGQYLYFTDLNLPQAFEVHFSNKERGESETQIGSNKLVEIPDKFFWSGALEIYAWVYLHNETDDGETIYEVRIPLIKRARPTDKEPLPDQQSAIDKAIAELNNAVNITNENADKTNADKTQVVTIKEEVVVLKEEINSTASAVSQDAQNANIAAERSEQFAQNSAESERKALDYSDEAKSYAQSALESKGTASQKAQIATDASVEAKGFRDEAETFKNEVEQIKQNVVDYRDETKGYRNETLNLKNTVQTLKSQTDETAEEIKNISDIVKEDAQSASQSASSANQSSINASQSASQAKKSANDAEESANQAEQNKGQTETFKNQSEEYKTQAGAFKSQAETFKNQAEEFKNQTETNVTHYPKIIGEYWYVWDATNGEYINTNVDANGIKGDTGRGIASIALNDDYTLTITFTDNTTYTTSSIRGQQGEKGDTGATGESGVYIGTEEPENEDIKVWIDTDDDGTSEDLIKNIESLKENIYKPYATDTASGSIASFSDGADGLPLKSLVVDINPVQDLHGQDAPYPAGGGKNLFDPSAAMIGINWNGSAMAYSITSDYISVEVGKRYTISVADMPKYTGVVVVCLDANKNYVVNGSTTTFDITDGIAFIRISFRCANTDVWTESDLNTAKIQVELGSTATSWSPYENLCPISGWTQVGVEQSGINLFDKATAVAGYIADGSGELKTQGSGQYSKSTDYISVKPNASYYISSEQTKGVWGAWYDKDKNYISGIKGYTATALDVQKTKTAPSNAYYMRLTVESYMSDTIYGNVDTFSINYPSTDHDYHPYAGRSITINLGQTVYGGKLDVLSGELVIDRAMVDLGTLDWRSAWGGFATYDLTDAMYTKEQVAMNMICSNYPNVSYNNRADKTIYGCDPNGQGNYNFVAVQDSGYSTLADFKTAMSGVQLCYELATPIEIQLTPNQLNSLYGVNNIWADSGDTEVEYRADTKLYINKKIAEALASLT